MASNKSKTKGVSLLGLMFLIFLYLKLAGVGQVAHWNWGLVTLPLWGPIALVVALLLFYVFCKGLIKILTKLFVK